MTKYNLIKMLITRKIILLLMFFCACEYQNKNKSNIQQFNHIGNKIDYEKLIIGEWEDENSIIEYKEQNNWIGNWAKGELFGNWNLKSDTLTMSFMLSKSEPVKYKINYMYEDSFCITALNDNKKFIKYRIN